MKVRKVESETLPTDSSCLPIFKATATCGIIMSKEQNSSIISRPSVLRDVLGTLIVEESKGFCSSLTVVFNGTVLLMIAVKLKGTGGECIFFCSMHFTGGVDTEECLNEGVIALYVYFRCMNASLRVSPATIAVVA